MARCGYVMEVRAHNKITVLNEHVMPFDGYWADNVVFIAERKFGTPYRVFFYYEGDEILDYVAGIFAGRVQEGVSLHHCFRNTFDFEDESLDRIIDLLQREEAASKIKTMRALIELDGLFSNGRRSKMLDELIQSRDCLQIQ